MAEEFHLEILVITILMVLSFVSGHLLRKFNILWLPESIVAVVLSMLMALIWYKMPGLSNGLAFNNETFFLVLLPFIIFESGFSVHRQSLFRNMGSILTFAIIGTFLSVFGIGGFLFVTAKARGYTFSFLDCMIVGSVLSSTDPVATLSIFSKLDMDRMTYSLVFGESMLNDAVSIVSFKTLASFYSVNFTVAVFFKAVGTFLLIFLGSTVIGLIMAALVSLILRRTDIGRNHKPLEVIFVVGGAYLSYFIPDFASLSGIVSIFFYGIASRHYTYYVLSEESQHGSHWIFESIKEVAEMLVFILLGVTIFEEGLKYDFFLIAMTCIGAVLARLLATGVLSFLLNLRRPESDRISLKSQLVIWNAGLRGAVAYALAVSSTMPKVNAENTNLMITTVHASVLFTIFFHGFLTVPIVAWTGLAGGGADSRQLSEPRPARKKVHSLWSRLDKTWIIPLISFARPSPGDVAEPRTDDHGLELDERDSSIDMPRHRVSYDGYEDNPNGLDHSLFSGTPKGPSLRSSSSSLQKSGERSASDSRSNKNVSSDDSEEMGSMASPPSSSSAIALDIDEADASGDSSMVSLDLDARANTIRSSSSSLSRSRKDL